LQGIRNFCDYLAAKSLPVDLWSRTGAGPGAAGACDIVVGIAIGDNAALVHDDTIIYFLLN
jgi:hypothetical protein